MPFSLEASWEFVKVRVKPERVGNREQRSGDEWWRLQRPRPELKAALSATDHYIATARVAKHRLFVRVATSVLPDSQVVAFARSDDATFGILHSRVHELWSLRICTWMGKGNDPRYTPTTWLRDLPLPPRPHPCRHRAPAHRDARRRRADPGRPRARRACARRGDRACREAPRRAARRLAEVPPQWAPSASPRSCRSAWRARRSPDRIVARAGFEQQVAKRTLTNLYNERPAWLAQAHAVLDAAVAAAYGWTDASPSLAEDAAPWPAARAQPRTSRGAGGEAVAAGGEPRYRYRQRGAAGLRPGDGEPADRTAGLPTLESVLTCPLEAMPGAR